MASIFIVWNKIIPPRVTETQRRAQNCFAFLYASVSPRLCVSVVKSALRLGTFLRSVRPSLIPVSQQERSVAFSVPLVSQYGKAVMEGPQKLLPVALLHFLRFGSRLSRGFPLVNL